MKKTTALFLLLLAMAAGCGKKTGAGLSKQTSSVKKIAPVFIGYRIPKREDFKVALQFNASIVPILQADIRPKQAGWLTQVTVNTGDKIAKGELLAEMDHVQLDQAVAQEQAQLSSARAAYQSLLSGYQSAFANVQKQEAITENDSLNMKRDKDLLRQGFVPQQQYDNARTAYLSDKASLESLRAQMMSVKSQVSFQKAQIAQAEALLGIAEANLRDSSLRAPFSGIVTMRNLDPGAYVSTAPATSTAPAILTIADLKQLKVIVSVTDRDVPKIRVGQEARISVDAYPGKNFGGLVSRIAGVLDPASRTLPVEVDIPNPRQALLPGMFAHVTITTRIRRNAIVLPLHAITLEGDKSYVWILETQRKTPDGKRLEVKAKKVEVETGSIEGSHVEILKGLNGNEMVVTDGIELIHPGVPLLAPLHPGMQLSVYSSELP